MSFALCRLSCKPEWSFPNMSNATNELLRQCADMPEVELSDDVDELIARSKAFPIPFPIETNRLGSLTGSGDPAAACATQVPELHNAHVTLGVCGPRARISGNTGLQSLRQHVLKS